MKTLPDPLGYLIAPVLVPSVHVLLTPVWAVLGGQPELAVSAMAWQVIAWFGLMAICLATLSPALWLARKHIHWFPHSSLSRRHRVTLGVVASGVASLLLIGTIEGVQSIPAAGLFAYFASACYLSGLHTKREGEA